MPYLLHYEAVPHHENHSLIVLEFHKLYQIQFREILA